MFPQHLILLLHLCIFDLITALTQSELRHRSIYQVLTDRFARSDGRYEAHCDPAEKVYCGGTWKGIELMLGYIQDMGFDTVVANVEEETEWGFAYHGYWASDIGKLNPHFGTHQDLKNLSDALHARGMYLMVDVVANHVGSVDLKSFAPGQHYGPFSEPEDFHPFCLPQNWDNPIEAEQCWLSQQMPDLNTESAHVVRHLHSWVAGLVRAFNIDALRIDTVKHVRKNFWPDFVNAAGVAAVGEVLHGGELYGSVKVGIYPNPPDPAFLAPYQKESVSSLLDYATYYSLRRVFMSTGVDVQDLREMIERLQRTVPDTSLLGSFLDNHDYERFAGMSQDPALAKNAAVYPFVNDGYPIVYSGQEHGLRGLEDPFNREAIWLHGYYADLPLLDFFRNLNTARRKAIAAYPQYLKIKLKPHRLDRHSLALVKPPFLSILTNYGSQVAATVLHLETTHTPYKPSLPIIDVLTNQVFATDQRGGLTIPIVNGEPRVFLPLDIWKGKGPVSRSSWSPSIPIKIDTSTGAGSHAGKPLTPGGMLKSPSLGLLMSWLGGSRGSKDHDL